MKLTSLFIACWTLSTTLYAYTKGKVYKITILHTNDHHGRFWENKDGELGLAARATLIQSIREQVKNEGGYVLLVDAGDVNTGIPQSDMLDAEPDFKGMSLLSYDVMAIGNHEFDNPISTIKLQQQWAGFPFVSANVYYKDKKERVFPSHIVKEVEDLKVTVFGLTTEDTPQKTNPLHTKDLCFRPAVEEAAELVPTLRNETDILMALTHIGHYPNESHGADAPGDVTLARKVDGIDIIVGGHTQKPLFEPDIQNGTIIVQAYEWGKYVGKIDLEFLDGKLTLKKYELIPVNLKTSTTRITPDPDVEAFLLPFKEKGDASLLVDVGASEGEFHGQRDVVRKQETNLGNLLTHIFKDKLKTDIALLNSGGIRDSIPKGKITYETILTVFPFNSEIVTAEMTGVELQNYLQYVLLTFNPGSGAFPQLSGVTAKVNKEEKKVHLLINGQEVDPNRTYSMAITEFTANGGDKYPTISFKRSGYVDAEMVREFILKAKVINPADYPVMNYLTFE